MTVLLRIFFALRRVGCRLGFHYHNGSPICPYCWDWRLGRPPRVRRFR